MRDLRGRCALITGAASGIGLGIARALAKRGVDIVLADVDATGLASATAGVAALGVRAVPVTMDVSDPKAWRNAEEVVRREFGQLDILVNNAGVTVTPRPLYDIPDADFEWIFAVNVFGLFHGVRTFAPMLIARDRGGHIVNTASMAGFQVGATVDVSPGIAYNATKSAVVALTEGLRVSLAPLGVGVSLLAPGAVKTGFDNVGRHRPQKFGGPTNSADQSRLAEILRAGLDPEFVGERVVHGVLNNEAYIFTNRYGKPMIDTRFQDLLGAFQGLDEFLALQTKPVAPSRDRLNEPPVR